MKCRVCRGPAVIDVRRQNANYCPEHFLRMCRDQVAKAIDEFDMIERGDRVLVAVSGGKDSLACWDILRHLGYDADGFVIGLGIGDYSDESSRYARAYADERGLHAARVRSARRVRLRRSDGGVGDPTRAVLGLRAVEAPLVRQGRARQRLRRRRHRSQPRRRSGSAVRQRAALADGLSRAATARCCPSAMASHGR